MHSPLNCLPGAGWAWIERGRQQVRVGPNLEIELNRNVAIKNGDQALVYYWYQSRNRAAASEYRNKLLLVRDALTIHRSEGALVRVTTRAFPGESRPDIDARSFIQAVYSVLTRHFPE
jgi:EpsI family protein